MNEHKKPRGNKAKNDKDSILADAKNLLYILHPAIQRMPKIDRIEGAPVEMKRAVQNIIRHFAIAKDSPASIKPDLLKSRSGFLFLYTTKNISKPQYTFRARLNDKYHLKLNSV